MSDNTALSQPPPLFMSEAPAAGAEPAPHDGAAAAVDSPALPAAGLAAAGEASTNPLGIDVVMLEDTCDQEFRAIGELNAESLQTMPPRAYLDATIVPVMLEGFKALVRERPPNPCEYLGLFLLKNSAKMDALAASTVAGRFGAENEDCLSTDLSSRNPRSPSSLAPPAKGPSSRRNSVMQ